MQKTETRAEIALPAAGAALVAEPRQAERTARWQPFEAAADKAVPITDPAPRYLISDLLVELEAYLPREQVGEVYRAYLFGAEAHQGQERQTGEPYIYHPIAVARILAEMRMDYKGLMAAILHDVIEDTATAKEHLAETFCKDVAELVDGVSKLTQIDFPSRAEAQAASFQKMMLAMTRDIRVILIKLADRLHNMRTLDAMMPAKRRRISRETLEIYAPIANRLGINRVRLDLEDLGFRHHWPWRHAVLSRAVKDKLQGQREMVAKVEETLRTRLQAEGIEGDVSGREKHLYSIYRKMSAKRRSFDDMVDVFGFRVVVDRVDTCYRVLGQVHDLYKPVPGRFKDYIAIPKSNGYQSLHTGLIGPQGVPIEIQIRTADMHRLAESGIAAHWMYKTGSEGSSGPQAAAKDWLQGLIEVQRDSGDSQEFLEHVKVDLFPDEVYVFTPKGRILVLPMGATVVDFAYAIHSDVGNTCVASRIDRRLASLRSPLRSGQTVEIITAPGAKPNAAWLNFVVTGKARASIRNFLKNLQNREAETLGKRMLSAELAAFGLTLEQIGKPRILAYALESGLEDAARLFAEIGLGNRMPMLVARRLAGPAEPAPGGEVATAQDGLDGDGTGRNARRLAIRGTEGMVVHFARCCRPIPGDPITGLFSAGKGIVVHRNECRNLGDFHSKRDKWIDVEWSEEPQAEFQTEIRVDVGNRRGALATIATAIAEQGSNIENVHSREKDGMTTTLDFLINVTGRRHLAGIMRRLRQVPTVTRILRLSNVGRLR